MGTYIFFLIPSFPMIGLDQLKYWFGSVITGLDGLILVWISYYWSRLVNIGLDGLNIKNHQLTLVKIGKDWLILVKMLVETYQH